MPLDELTHMKFDMKDMKNDIKNIGTDLTELKSDVRAFIDKSESRFAGKWTEKVMVWGGGLVGAAILTALMALILR